MERALVFLAECLGCAAEVLAKGAGPWIAHSKTKSSSSGGGAKNLGGLISRAFASEGARIVVHYNSAATRADAERTVADIKQAGDFLIQEAGRQLSDHGKICTIVSSLLAAYTGYYATYGGMKAPVEHFTPDRPSSPTAVIRHVSLEAAGFKSA